MKISEFARIYPTYVIDFEAQVRDQLRIYQGATLDQFPIELEADEPYQVGRRGRPNRNQTLTHSQCATCLRVLRNDFFYTVPSMMKRNVVFPHCRECNQAHNAARHEVRADVIRLRRAAIWNYLAPECAVCGFNSHHSALELHHSQNKEPLVAELISSVTLSLEASKVEALLREAAKCVPLCSNCHRMLHASVVKIPTNFAPPRFQIAQLLAALNAI